MTQNTPRRAKTKQSEPKWPKKEPNWPEATLNKLKRPNIIHKMTHKLTQKVSN